MKLIAKRGAPISSPLPHPSPATFGVVRLAWAATLLASPARVVKAFGSPVDRTSVTVARVLGARHAIQGLVEVAAGPKWSRASAFVDGAHSLTAAGRLSRRCASCSALGAVEHAMPCRPPMSGKG
jgi:hypothetical protein